MYPIQQHSLYSRIHTMFGFVVLMLCCQQCQYPDPVAFVELKAEFICDTLVRVGTPVTFRKSDTPSADSFIWEFHDDSKSTAPNPEYTYTAPGYYRVRLIVQKKANKDAREQADTFEQYIRVLPATTPIAALGQQKIYGSNTNHEEGNGIAPTADGGYLLAGAQNGERIYLVKVDAQLNEIWNNTIDMGNRWVVVTQIITVTNKSSAGLGLAYVVTGYYEIAPSRYDAFVVGVDAQGNRVWQHHLQSQTIEDQYQGVVEIGGNFWVLGDNGEASFIDIYSPSGKQVNRQIIDAPFSAQSISTTQNGDIVLGGSSARQPAVLRTDLNFSNILLKQSRLRLPDDNDVCMSGVTYRAKELSNNEIGFVSRAKIDLDIDCQDLRPLTDSAFQVYQTLFQNLGATQELISEGFATFSPQLLNTRRWQVLASVFNFPYRIADFIETQNGLIIIMGTYPNPLNGSSDIFYFAIQLDGTTKAKLMGSNQSENVQAMYYDKAKNSVVFLGNILGNNSLSSLLVGKIDLK